jgi:peptide-methionine (S)-S-oxide reductase
MGVQAVITGYANGTVDDCSLEQVEEGKTGHTQVCQVYFDPEFVTYEKLLEVFWKIHDPTQLNRQYDDYGFYYRSLIIYHNEDQKKRADLSITQNLKYFYPNLIATALEPMGKFCPAITKY